MPIQLMVINEFADSLTKILLLVSGLLIYYAL